MLKVIRKRNLYFTISAVLCLVSVLSLIAWGLKPGIDFTGGTLMEVEFQNVSRPQANEIKEILESAEMDIGDVSVRPAGQNSMIIRLAAVDEDKHQEILAAIRNEFVPESAEMSESRYESIGAVIGQELRKKATWSIALVVIAIVLYIAWAFRKVSKPVASWKYGIGAIVALCHDILIVTGVFSILGRFVGIEVDILFITALLTILGYSVNDTIVVYDRTRENLHKRSGNFEETVNRSVNETLRRSINTSLTTLLVLVAVFIFGGESIRYFVLALILGALVGTYSSVFIASPLLVVWQKLKLKKG